MNKALLEAQDQAQFEALILGLLDNQYGVCDGFLDETTLIGLRANLENYKQAGQMHPAGVGKKFDYQKNTMIRGDMIHWIEKNPTNPYEALFLEKVSHFVDYLNKSCYTSINDVEFHYAQYEPGSFYKRHLDQFKSDKGRKFSLVIYLNEHWTASDGGNISLFVDENNVIDIYPIGGRVVFFRSDEMEHEVHPSFTRNRISIAGWLKSV